MTSDAKSTLDLWSCD